MFKQMIVAGLTFVGLVISFQASPAAAAITHIPWGRTPSGEPVELYTLSNSSGMEVRVATYGGNATFSE